MSAPAVLREVQPKALDGAVVEQIGDFRFRGLLSPADWAALPPAVRHRFSKRLAGGAATIYTGHVTVCAMSRTGWLLAQALRIIGAPLPLARNTGLPTVVTVTGEGVSGGQNWTRVYARKSGFPQVIHSTKRFSVRRGSRNTSATASEWRWR
jgi:hypothetical protein